MTTNLEWDVLTCSEVLEGALGLAVLDEDLGLEVELESLKVIMLGVVML